MANIYTKYKISRSLNGDKIVYLARVGKQQTLVMRANSEAQLIRLMATEAKRLDEEALAQEETRKAKLAQANQKKRKLGLWKPGRFVAKKVQDGTGETEATTEPETGGTKIAVQNESLDDNRSATSHS